MKKTLYIILLSPLFLFSSCEKEEVYGCSNPNANNYNSYATADNGTCEYQRKISFYLNESASDYFWDAGHTTLKVYVNGNLEGYLNTNYYYTSSPNCGQNTDGMHTVTLPTSYSESETVSY